MPQEPERRTMTHRLQKRKTKREKKKKKEKHPLDLTFRKSLVTALEGCCSEEETAVIMELTEQGEGRGRRSGGCAQRPVQTGGCSYRLKESGENQR